MSRPYLSICHWRRFVATSLRRFASVTGQRREAFYVLRASAMDDPALSTPKIPHFTSFIPLIFFEHEGAACATHSVAIFSRPQFAFRRFQYRHDRPCSGIKADRLPGQGSFHGHARIHRVSLFSIMACDRLWRLCSSTKFKVAIDDSIAPLAVFSMNSSRHPPLDMSRATGSRTRQTFSVRILWPAAFG